MLKMSGREKQIEQFLAHFPKVIDDVRTILSTDSPDIPKDTVDRLVKILEYNVPHGKLNRGMTVVLTYNHLIDEKFKTPEGLMVANYLGWCVEMLQGCLLIADDLMDSSKLRRGQPSWYTLPDTGLNAVMDSKFVNYIVFDILKRQLDKPSYHYCYRNIVDTFLDCQRKTSVGLIHEYITQNKGYQLFETISNRTIAIYKTAYYTYVLPVFIGMYLSGIKDMDLFKETEKVLVMIGCFFQVQDDYLDCFGSKESIGKSGTDIIEGKCSWPFVKSLENSNADQRKILLENYGKDDSVCEDRVKKVYREVGVPKLYEEQEETSYQEISERIRTISNQGLRQLLLRLVDQIYKRVH